MKVYIIQIILLSIKEITCNYIFTFEGNEDSIFEKVNTSEVLTPANNIDELIVLTVSQKFYFQPWENQILFYKIKPECKKTGLKDLFSARRHMAIPRSDVVIKEVENDGKVYFNVL